MNEWNIQSRGRACEVCERAFSDQQSYHTLLIDEKTGFRRSDVCDACWQKDYSEGASDRKGFVSCWQGIFEAPAAAPPEAIQKDTAESLLRQLAELNDPRHIPASYILAVMLERKRLIKIKEQIARDDHRVFIYEQPKTGDVFTIVDPNLRFDQLEQVQRDVADLLEHGLNPAGPPPADALTETPVSSEAPPAQDVLTAEATG